MTLIAPFNPGAKVTNPDDTPSAYFLRWLEEQRVRTNDGLTVKETTFYETLSEFESDVAAGTSFDDGAVVFAVGIPYVKDGGSAIATLPGWTRIVFDIASGGTGAASPSDARTNLGLAIGTDVQAYSANLATYVSNPLTAAELQQLQAIGATTVSAVQWGHLGALDQGVATTDSPAFESLNLINSTAIGNFDGDEVDGQIDEFDLDGNKRYFKKSAVRLANEGAATWYNTAIRLEANVDNNNSVQQWIHFISGINTGDNAISFGEGDGDTGEWMRISDGGIQLDGAVIQQASFPTRADFVSSLSNLSLAAGDVVVAGGLAYKHSPGATDISDLADFVPHGAISPLHFADVAEGGDISSALSAALDYAKSVNQWVVLPAGSYNIATAIEKSWATGWRGGIVGQGKDVTILTVTNATGGIIMETTGVERDNNVTLRDFTILPGALGGIGLAFDQPQGGARHEATVQTNNLQIGYGTDVTNYFDTYLSLKGSWHANIENTVLDAPWLGEDLQDSSAKYLPSKMLDLEGAYGPQIHRCRIYGGDYGIYAEEYVGTITAVADAGGGAVTITVSNAHGFQAGSGVLIAGTTDYNGTYTVQSRVSDTQFTITETFTSSQTGTVSESRAPESFKFNYSAIVDSKTGIYYRRRSGREPSFLVTHNHINYRDYGIRVNGANQIHIAHNYIYNTDSSAYGIANPRDVYIEDGQEGFICHNNFHFVNTNSGRQNVYILDNGSGPSGHDFIIRENIFESGGQNCVLMELGTDGIICTSNRVTGTYTGTKFYNVGSNNFVQTDDYGACVITWTPTVTFVGGSDPTLTTATGEMVVAEGGVASVYIYLDFSANGSGASAVDIDLPTIPGPWKTTAGEGHFHFVAYAGMVSLSSPVGRPFTASTIRLFNQGATTLSALTDSNFSSSTILALSGTLQLTS